MKSFLSFLFAAVVQLTAHAGVEVGNGGNVIVCKNAAGGIASVELLDFYEARLNGLSLKLNPLLTNHKDILMDNLDRWQRVAPKRVELYKSWLASFESESLMASGVYIPPITDTGSVVVPLGCELKPLAFQRQDSEILPGVKRYTINKDLWDMMDEVQRAGLVMHELIYREGIKAGHKTSHPTRYFNSYLASAAPSSMEYAYVAYVMPLTWVEVGQGMVLNIGQVENTWNGGKHFNYSSEVYQNGRFKGEGKIFSTVEVDGFKVVVEDPFNWSPEYGPMLDGIYTTSDTRVGFVTQNWKTIKLIGSRIPNGYIEIPNLKLQKEVYKFRFEFTRWKPESIVMLTVEGIENTSFVNTNPQTTWVRAKNGLLIQNISKIHRKNRSFYGEILETAKGEKWAYDEKADNYVLTPKPK